MSLTWEYKTVKFVTSDYGLDDELNKLGKEGWEIISITETMPFMVSFAPDGVINKEFMVRFKKQWTN